MKHKKPCILGYLRVSSDKQARDGKGIKRQTDVVTMAGERLENDLSLPWVGTVADEGLSAFHGVNTSEGIMSDIIGGAMIPSGSVLVLENFDRLSRQDPLEVLSILKRILDQGIRVYIAHREELIDSVSIADTSQILTSILSISLSHEESLKKSKRMTAVYDKQLKDAKTKSGAVKIGRAPAWLQRDKDQSWVLIPERAKIVREIVDMSLAGMGAGMIAKELNERGEAPFRTVQGQKRNHNDTSGVWHSSTISRMIKNRALIGEATFNRAGDDPVVVDGYYPKVINMANFLKLQEIIASRGTGGGKGRNSLVQAMLTGQRLCVCGYCGSGIIAKSDGRSRRPNAKVTRSLVCSGYVKKYSLQCAGGSMNAEKLEHALLMFCASKVNFSDAFGDEAEELEKAKIALADEQAILAKLTSQQSKLIELFTLTDGDDPLLKEKFTQGREAIKQATEKVGELEDVINSMVGDETTIQDQYMELVSMVDGDGIPDDLRLKLKILIHRFIERITIYTYGTGYKTDPEAHADKLRAMGVDEDVIAHALEVGTTKDRTQGVAVVEFKTGAVSVIRPMAEEWQHFHIEQGLTN
ncbi:recombinase family protein [Vibrio sp. WXL210]|uniref:recombinase family protein n=1 Tax=Vibrio sp. WXL210 TaxID=3450709 RepID=UPI003EC91944